jgi:hypothetical protein
VLATAGQVCNVAGSYSTTGNFEFAGHATGSGAQMIGPGNGAVSFSSSGLNTTALRADKGGSISLTGGVVTSSGNGTATFQVLTGGSIVASGLTINSLGERDTESGLNPSIAQNGFTPPGNGGTLQLLNSTILSTGAQNFGIATSNSGITTLTNNSITASGASATAVSTDTGGHTTISGGSINVSGLGGDGLFAIDNGTKITASNVAITATAGTDPDTGYTSVGIDAQSGASEIFSGGSITTSGASANAAQTLNGSVTISGTTILTTANGASGLLAIGSGASMTATNVSVTTRGGVDSSDGFHAFGAYNGYSNYPPGYPSGGALTLTNTSITTTGSGANGVTTNSGGVTTINGGAVSTAGANAIGLYATGVGSSIATSNGTTIATNGSQANGVQADTQGLVTLNGGSVSVGSYQSFDLIAKGSGTQIQATNLASTSSVSNWTAVQADTGSSLTYTGGSITTTGASALNVLAIHGSSITLSGTIIEADGNGTGVLSIGDCCSSTPDSGASITGTGLTIISKGTTDPATGYNSSFANNSNGGTLNLSNSTLSTTGDQNFGVNTIKTSATTLTNDSILVSGVNAQAVGAQLGGQTTINSASSITTAGRDDSGIDVESGAQVTMTGGTVTTSGNGSQGFLAEGTGSILTANSVSVSSSGTTDPITTFHDFAMQAIDGGHIVLNGGSASTSGFNSTALFSRDGGSIDATDIVVSTTGASALGLLSFNQFGTGGNATFSGGSITTSGASADAVASDGRGSSIALGGGTTILTTGNGSAGLVVVGSGAALTATGIGITTHGDEDPSDGFLAFGAYNGKDPADGFLSGGTMKLTDTTIHTTGSDAYGVDTNGGGVTTISGGSVTTSGLHAIGVLTQGSGTSASLTGTTISTSGNASTGVELNGTGSSVSLSDVTITTTGTLDPTTGFNTQGFYNGTNGLGTVIGGGAATITNSSISTSGANSNAILTRDGGTTSVTGGTASTSGVFAHGVLTEGSGTSVSLTGTTITTTGNGSPGAVLVGTGSAMMLSNVGITTSGTTDEGGHNAVGVFNGSASSGLYPGGGTLGISNSGIETMGDLSIGVETANGGKTTISGGAVTTKGNAAYAVTVNSGGVTTLNGIAIVTTGNGSGGLAINGAGSEIDATGVTIATSGGLDLASGQHSYGIYNGYFGTFLNGGVATVSNSLVGTQGLKMYGIFTQSGGVTNLSGDTVVTTGQDAHALYVTGAHSQVNLSGTNSLSTQGDGASGVVASLGGVVTATGSTTVTTLGGMSPATGFGANGVAADGSGAQVNLGAATITTTGPGGYGLVAADTTSSGAAGSIIVSGALNIVTTDPTSAAVGLQGDGASILATGGGTIASTGNAIAFLGGTGQTATFDGFTINNQSGDLIFADPSVATVNFNNTIATAGAGNLLNATNSSAITFNASASTVTGPIQTDATSNTNVNLNNGTKWVMTAPSTVTNLNVTNSIVVFAPPGSGQAFKILTVTNYVGSGANITMNASVAGASSASDQIVVNGGSATGQTLLTIHNVGAPGGQTTGAGIPLVVATNSGSIATNAFALANTTVAGGFRYVLDQTSDSVYLTSTPAPTVAGVTQSVNSIVKAQQSAIVTNRLLSSILLGATQQVSSCSCGGGFASVGSFAAGSQGRWSLSDQLTLLGGFSYNQYNSQGLSVSNAPTVAGSLIYDFWKWGSSRPFVEAGAALTPYSDVHYSRTYANGVTPAVGDASAINRNLSLFGRAGWIARLSSVDEAAVYGDLSRSWMQTGGYTEGTTAVNPFPETVAPGLDALNVARVGAQYTRLFDGNIEANVSAAVAYGFGAGSGAAVSVYDFGPIAPNAVANTTWVEYGARLGYRFNDRMVVDAFVIGTLFGTVGSTIHGGVGLRYSF